eukprot:1810487-Rhodomonas_salina.2
MQKESINFNLNAGCVAQRHITHAQYWRSTGVLTHPIQTQYRHGCTRTQYCSGYGAMLRKVGD